MKIVRIFFLVCVLLSSPFLGMGILFGLAGSNAEHFLLIGAGYLIVIFFSVIGIFKPKYYLGCIFGVGLMLVGSLLSQRFWSQHNEELCRQLRAEPSCVENDLGFTCTDFKGIGFNAGKHVCSN